MAYHKIWKSVAGVVDKFCIERNVVQNDSLVGVATYLDRASARYSTEQEALRTGRGEEASALSCRFVEYL